MSSNVQLDPFVAQAQNDNVAPLKKVEGTDYDNLVQTLGSRKRTMPISSIGRSEQYHFGGPGGYAHDSRVGWPSPFASDDPSLP